MTTQDTTVKMNSDDIGGASTINDTTYCHQANAIQQDSPLLELPPELRNAIYKYVLFEPPIYDSRIRQYRAGRPQIPALLTLCLQIRREAKPIFSNEVYLGDLYAHEPQPITRWLRDIGEENRALIKTLRVSCDKFLRHQWERATLQATTNVARAFFDLDVEPNSVIYCLGPDRFEINTCVLRSLGNFDRELGKLWRRAQPCGRVQFYTRGASNNMEPSEIKLCDCDPLPKWNVRTPGI